MMHEIITIVVPSHWDGITLCIIPALIAAGGTLLSSLFSGLFSSSNSNKNLQSTRETNATNLQIHREDNAFNAQQSDQAWQRTQQMFHMENAYNSPMQQIQRLQAAGLNPAVAMGNTPPAQAQGASPSPATAAAAPTMIPPTIDPTLGPWQSISQIIPQLGKIAGEAIDAQYLGKSLNDRLRQLNLDANTQQYTLEVLLPLEGKLKEHSIMQIAQAIKESESLVEKFKVEKLHTEEDIKRITAQVNDIMEGISLKGKQRELLQKQINSYERELNARLRNLILQGSRSGLDIHVHELLLTVLNLIILLLALSVSGYVTGLGGEVTETGVEFSFV